MKQKDPAPSTGSAAGSSTDPANRTIPRVAQDTPAAQDHTRVASTRRAPTSDAAAFGLPAHPACPFCAAGNTELHSPFGPQLSVATYWCNDCRTPFEYLKWRGPRSR